MFRGQHDPQSAARDAQLHAGSESNRHGRKFQIMRATTIRSVAARAAIRAVYS